MDKERIYEINRTAANIYYTTLKSGQDKTGLDYITSRGITSQTIKDFGLGYAPDQWDFMTKSLLNRGFKPDELIEAGISSRSEKSGKLYDKFRNRVMFPIVDLHGDVIGFGGRTLSDDKSIPKYLNTSENEAFNKGLNLFAMNHAKRADSDSLILCEGYMDAIAMQQAGIKEAIATLGTALTKEQAALISKFTDEAICAYDNDDAGTKAKLKAVELLSDAGVKVRVLNMSNVPEKDPDEYIKAHGGAEFRKFLDNAEPAVDFVIRTMNERTDLTTENGKKALANALSHPMKLLPEAERELLAVSLFEEYGIITENSKDKIHHGIVFGDNDTPAPASKREESGLTEEQKAVLHELENTENGYVNGRAGTNKSVVTGNETIYDLSPMTSVADLDLPEDMINVLGTSGITILAEVMELSPADMKEVFDGDMKMVNQLCDFVGIDADNRDITD